MMEINKSKKNLFEMEGNIKQWTSIFPVGSVIFPSRLIKVDLSYGVHRAQLLG